MEVRMTTKSEDDDRCRVPHAEHERADVPCPIDAGPDAERDDEDGYGFGV